MKISVIIPALNEAQNILGCLDSIRMQQGELEIILVDGCSTDGTAELARPYARVISSPSANSDFFGEPFLASGTPANPMSEPSCGRQEERVLDLQ